MHFVYFKVYVTGDNFYSGSSVFIIIYLQLLLIIFNVLVYFIYSVIVEVNQATIFDIIIFSTAMLLNILNRQHQR